MSQHDFQTMRAAMVSSQLRTNHVNDPEIIAAMRAVPREAFVPAERKALAYVDVSVPLGGGRALNPPLATGRLLMEANIAKGAKVLLIAAATGYAAALLVALGADVTAVESSSELLKSAMDKMDSGDGVHFVQGAMAEGHAERAPYDAIVIDGTVENIPDALVDQLSTGGRLTCGLVENGVTRLVRGAKSAGGFATVALAEIEFAPIPGFSSPSGFSF